MEDKDFLDISTYIEDLLEFEMLVDESKKEIYSNVQSAWIIKSRRSRDGS